MTFSTIIESFFQVILRASVAVAIFFPLIAFAVVADPSLLPQQITKFSTMAVAGSSSQEEMVSRLIVKPRTREGDQLNTELRGHDARRLAKVSNVSMSVVRPMSGDAHVISLDQPVTLSEARVIAARLMQDSSVELAEPDRRRRPALTPTDQLYTIDQWNLFVPASQNLGSADLPNAWDITKGINTVTVAVIDTGYRPHQDLGAVILPGYDFISSDPGSNPPTYLTANDGNGRDADAQDPGDWITSTENASGLFKGCGVSNSSWHGTHVSGIIAAQMNNIGITGIAPNIQILPVRVLGKCGGYDSDIIDGMNWAAGFVVPGVPKNTNPAKVLNMSLGGSGACSPLYQTAVTNIINAGKVIVVAAGNDGTSTLSTPANCTGVIAVTANSIDGDNAWYSTIGLGTTISAPGGGCGGMNYPNGCTTANSVAVYSLLNSGTTSPVASPGGDIYFAYMGTSMATPHVSAVAALMFSIKPSLTPAQITSYLQSSARPFPSNTICTQTVNLNMCGAGLLDAYKALIAVQPSLISSPVVTLGSIPATVVTGTTVTLSGSALTAIGRNISYAWTQVSGPSVTISNANTANATFTASVPGNYSFTLTATDSAALTGTATAAIVVTTPPAVAVTLGSIPSTVIAGTVVTLTGSATSTSGGSITYAWTQQSGPATVTITNANSSTASFTPTAPGTYTFKLTATDNVGQTGSASDVILVTPSNPVVTLGSIPTSVASGTTVTLVGSAAVAVTGRIITSYAWTQLSGPTVNISNPSSSTNASFTPTTAGSYTFMLTATDSSFQIGTATTPPINVSAPNSIAPPIGGGGGGSMDIEILAVLALLATGLRLRRRYIDLR